jgi:type III secretion protein J
MRRLASLALLPPLLLLGACRDQQLLRGLTEQQANQVVAVLQARNISVAKNELGKSGFSVEVAQADFPAAVDLLEKYGLPSPPRVEIARSFPDNALVASPQAEQARLLSAIEQRLAQNLEAMDNVVSARVQLSYPLQAEASGTPSTAMHAAVLVAYRNQVDTDVLVSQIKRFVKNSFTNISYDDISVIVRPAPPVFRVGATEPPSPGIQGWLYALLAVPLLATIAGLAALGYGRRKKSGQVEQEQASARSGREPPPASPAESATTSSIADRRWVGASEGKHESHRAA